MILEMKKLTLIGHKSVRHKLFRNFNRTRLVEVVSTEDISNTKRLDNQQRTAGITSKMQSIDFALESIRQVKNEAKVTIKNGIAKSEKEFTPETMRCTIDISGILRCTAVTTEEANSVNVIGTLKINKTKKLPIKINEAV